MAGRRHIARAVRLTAGMILVLAGVAGLFLPILQGTLLLVLGVSVLAIDWPPARRLFAALRVRHPKASAAARSLRVRLRRLMSGRKPVRTRKP